MASKIIERGVRGIPRNEILLENLTASPPPGEWRYPNTRAFRVISGRTLKISHYYESDANIEFINLMVRFLDRDKTFISAPVIGLEANVSKREIHSVTVPEGTVYAQVQLAAKSYAGVTGTASFKDIVVFGNAIPVKKPWFERNAKEIIKRFEGTVVAGTGWTNPWSYTVPSGRMARIVSWNTAVSVDSDLVNAIIELKGTDNIIYTRLGRHSLVVRDFQYTNAPLVTGQMIVGAYRNADTIDREVNTMAIILEFDQD